MNLDAKLREALWRGAAQEVASMLLQNLAGIPG
jgi:hypothetical protein